MESELQEREIYGTFTLRIAEVHIGTGFDEEVHNVLLLDSACCLKVQIPVMLEPKPLLPKKKCFARRITSKKDVFRPQEKWEFGIAFFFSRVRKKCTDLHLILFYTLISGTNSKFARENDFLALGVCFPQPCSTAGPVFATSRSLLREYYLRMIVFPQQQIQ